VQIDLLAILNAVGPSATLSFASWWFLSFLQGRYASSYDRYRALIDEFRQNRDATDPHHESTGAQVRLYRKRVEQMRLATTGGIIASMLLVVTTLTGALVAMIPQLSSLRYLGAATMVLGLVTLLVAASFVIRENTLIRHAMDSEISDLPELDR
jgi:hypothetical protein